MSFAMSVTTDSIDSYINTIRSIPLLSAEEEFELATQYVETQDPSIAHKLVMANLRFVVYVARKLEGYGLPRADLIQEGNIGLMKAVKRFDPTTGFRLASFAIHWIRASMTEYIIKNWKIVKIATTKPQRKLFFNIRSQLRENKFFSADEIKKIATDLNVKEDDVRTMEGRFTGHDVSFNVTNDEDDDFGPELYLQSDDLIEKYEHEQHHQYQLSRLNHAIDSLAPRAQEIIRRRWMQDDDENKAPLRILAEEFGVSVERIRQIEHESIKKLQQMVNN